MNVLLEHALRYASLGWRVLPIVPRQKFPRTKHGIKDATINEDQIEQWWHEEPASNIAVACGAESGIYVVDIDVSAYGDTDGRKALEEFNQPLPETVRQDTPRGGFHAFYKADNPSDPPPSRNKFRPGIDIRGNGYYVVVAPSIHPNGGQYLWTPGHAPWECELAPFPAFLRPTARAPWDGPRAAQAPSVASQAISGPPGDDVIYRAGLYLDKCEPAVQGQYGHNKILKAAYYLTLGFAFSDEEAYGLLVARYNPRCIPPWDLSLQKDYKDFTRKIPESRKLPLPPGKQIGWLRNEYHGESIPPSTEAFVAAMLTKLPRASLAKAASDDLSEIVDDINSLQPGHLQEKLRYLCAPTGLLGEICSWINSTAIKPQPFLALGCSLAFLGTLFGRKVKDELGGRTNVYTMGVAPSSAGKAHAMNQIRRLAEASGCLGLLGGDDIASDAAIESRLARAPSTLFLWDEIGHLFSLIKRGSNKHLSHRVVSVLMKLYSSANSVYLGREYADETKQKLIIQPCCCVYGTSTPERLAGGISIEELHDGWLGRCLVFSTNDNPEKNRAIQTLSDLPPERLVKQIRAWHERDLGFALAPTGLQTYLTNSGNTQIKKQITVRATSEARAQFVALDTEMRDKANRVKKISSLLLKAEENARRVALIIATGENYESPVISESVAHYACELMRYLLADFARVIVPEITETIIDHQKRRLIKIIADRGSKGVTKRDLTRASQFLNQQQRDALLTDLIAAEEIVSDASPTKKTVCFWTSSHYVEYKQGQCTSTNQ